MKYYTQVNEQEFIIEIDQDMAITVNGEPYAINFQQLPEGGLVSLLLEQYSLEGVVEVLEDDQWEVLIEGELYNVTVQDERAHRLAQARGTFVDASGDVAIESPMPGIIVAVPVTTGQVVSKGDKVIILESMKMENELRAPKDGIISQVNVQAGASVEKGETLAVISEPQDEDFVGAAN